MDKNVAFLTEMGFIGNIPVNHSNMRTEFAWMLSMNATHYCIYRDIHLVKDYDEVFIIFPKGKTFLSAEGSRLVDGINPASNLLSQDFVSVLRKQNNKQISYIQEGPHWWWNDYEIIDQVGFFNFVSSCDKIYAHNTSDAKYYRGIFPSVEVDIIRTLMIDKLIENILPSPEDKVIIGGNFARWYGGFESYIVASDFGVPIWAQTSHSTREQENQMENLHHFPRLDWLDWMRELSKFKYAVHLMPTVAAGTFSLNCAYFGIPTIGNINVDTQKICHPDLSVDVYDIESARMLVNKLKDDQEFYNHCSTTAVKNYQTYYRL
jgi:hypothetical protein